MRIISGKYRGRVLSGYNIDGTRPTMDRVKESLIATINPYLKGATVVDLFAGSGSVGLEMISNGATKLYLGDNNKIAIDTLKKNVKLLNPCEKVEIIQGDFQSTLKKLSNIDIIFLDPPYKFDFISKSLKIIKENNILNEDGIIVCEYENENIDFTDFEIIKEKKYGSKKVTIVKL